MIDRPNSILLVAIVIVLVSASLAIAFGPTGTARSQGSAEFVFETVGSLDGSYNAIARTADGYLLLGSHGKVDVVDARDRAAPRVVGTFTGLSGDVPGIAVDGRSAYVAASADGLLVLDVTTPAAPTLVGQYRPGPLRGVAAREALAVVAGEDRVYFVDVSDASRPRELSSVAANVIKPVLSGDVALLGGARPVLSVMGIGDPERPTELGRWDPDPGGWGSDVVVDAANELAYVGRSVPWSLLIPTPGPTVTPGGPTCTPTLSATRPADEAWLHVVSLATPAAPAGEGAWSSVGADMHVSALAVDPDRGLALVGMLSPTDYRRARLVALDVSGSGPPDYLAAIELPAQDMAMSGGLLYVAAGDQGLRILRPWARASTLFLPRAMRHADLVSTAEPTASPTVKRTPLPSYFGLDGYVVEGSASGHGVPGVEIALWVDGAAQSPVHTDADGFYSTPILELQAADWVAIPRKEGFTFEPATVTGRHEGRPGEHVQRVSFMAFRGTPTPSAP